MLVWQASEVLQNIGKAVLAVLPNCIVSQWKPLLLMIFLMIL